MRTDQFSYTLPPELVAQRPVEPRDHSRLLVLNREQKSITHRLFYNLPEYLRPGDLLVANESRVLPARLFGHKLGTGGKVEVLLLRPHLPPSEADGQPQSWEALLSPGRRVAEGTRLGFGNPELGPYIEAEVVARAELGSRILRFNEPPGPHLDALGEMPLPPYIHDTLADPERYQTVYARTEGSAAAPTAGLHFTRRLIDELSEAGVGFATVVLHVGLDTFRPVQEDVAEDHPMHREWFHLPQPTAEALNRAREQNGRIVAVGTTSVRVLETVAALQSLDHELHNQPIQATEGWSQLFIRPGYRFHLVDALITNFHLPRTTLLMLVSAFAGRETVLEAYEQAIEEKYRFYSFGDAMLIL